MTSQRAGWLPKLLLKYVNFYYLLLFVPRALKRITIAPPVSNSLLYKL